MLSDWDLLLMPELLNADCDKGASKLNNMVIEPPAPYHLCYQPATPTYSLLRECPSATYNPIY